MTIKNDGLIEKALQEARGKSKAYLKESTRYEQICKTLEKALEIESEVETSLDADAAPVKTKGVGSGNYVRKPKINLHPQIKKARAPYRKSGDTPTWGSAFSQVLKESGAPMAKRALADAGLKIRGAGSKHGAYIALCGYLKTGLLMEHVADGTVSLLS